MISLGVQETMMKFISFQMSNFPVFDVLCLSVIVNLVDTLCFTLMESFIHPFKTVFVSIQFFGHFYKCIPFKIPFNVYIF